MIGWTVDDIKQIIGVLEQTTSFTAANVPENEAPYEKALKFLLEKGIVNIVAGDVDYDNTISGLTAENVQEALDELDALLDILNANEKVITYYEVVSAASSGNAVNVPASGTILLDRFGSSKDAILSRIDGNNIPTYESPSDASGNVVTASLALDGTYLFSTTPVDTDVAIIYVFKILTQDYPEVDIDFVISETENVPIASEVNYDNDTSGLIATDVQGAIDELQEKSNATHHQSVAALVWSVPHNLNKRCAVQIVNNSLHEIEGDIRWVNDNEVEITFNTARTGYVYCN